MPCELTCALFVCLFVCFQPEPVHEEPPQDDDLYENVEESSMPEVFHSEAPKYVPDDTYEEVETIDTQPEAEDLYENVEESEPVPEKV